MRLFTREVFIYTGSGATNIYLLNCCQAGSPRWVWLGEARKCVHCSTSKTRKETSSRGQVLSADTACREAGASRRVCGPAFPFSLSKVLPVSVLRRCTQLRDRPVDRFSLFSRRSLYYYIVRSRLADVVGRPAMPCAAASLPPQRLQASYCFACSWYTVKAAVKVQSIDAHESSEHRLTPHRLAIFRSSNRLITMHP
jgi:hypothetical protein